MGNGDEDRKEVRDKLVGIIENIDDEISLEDLNDDKMLKDQLDLDSMDALDIIMEVRKEYGINIPETDYPFFGTMNSSIDYILKRTQPK